MIPTLENYIADQLFKINKSDDTINDFFSDRDLDFHLKAQNNKRNNQLAIP